MLPAMEVFRSRARLFVLLSALVSLGSGCAFDPANPLAIGADGSGLPGIDALLPGDAEPPIDGAADAGGAGDGPLDPDGGPGDGSPADTGAPDVEPGETGGAPDADPADGGPAEAGPSDGGPGDGAALDAATPDAAPRDGGPVDGGPGDAGGPPFPFAPSNLAAGAVGPVSVTAAVIDVPTGQTCFVDSRTGVISGVCGNAAPSSAAVVQMPGGGEAALITLARLRVQGNAITQGTLRLTGSRPVIFLVRGDADLEGSIDASADENSPGPGAGTNAQCGSAIGGRGTDADEAAGGGGGGARGSRGGHGGEGADEASIPGGARGEAFDDPSLTPLFGGCAGGAGGNVPVGQGSGGAGGAGGAGGGAVQITSGGLLRVTGRLHAGGGGGQGGGARAAGAGGGGSGGAILLESTTLLLDTLARIAANGGGGGEGGSRAAPAEGGTSGEEGENAELSSTSPGRGGGNTTASGGDGGDGAFGSTSARDGDDGSAPAGANGGGGGGAGGGGMGRLRLRASTCTINTNRVSAIVRNECP